MKRAGCWLPLSLCVALIACGREERGSNLDLPTLREIGIDQRIDAQVPLDLGFVDSAGRRVLLGEVLGGRPVVLALVYHTCPMLCSQVLTGLASALKVMTLEPGRDFDVVAVSFDPKDPPSLAAEVKQRFVQRYGRAGAEGARFLVGEQASIAALTAAVGFRYRYDEALGQYAHPSALVVLTPDGRVARYFFGAEYSPRDLRLGLREASGGKVGNVSDALLLLCYSYDPKSGSYSFTALNAIRIGGLLTVALLVAFVGTSLVRERRRRAAGAGGGNG